MPQHVAKALDIVGNCGFSKHIEVLEDALVWEVQMTVAVATVLLGDLLQRTFLGDVSLLLAVVAEAAAASLPRRRGCSTGPPHQGVRGIQSLVAVVIRV